METREIIHFTEAPEIRHLAVGKVSNNDNAYGVTWGNLVREYLSTAYSEENAEAEVVSFGITYKVLKRNKVTAFYDSDGNTLFDVENTRLEKEHGWLMNTPVEPENETERSKPVTPMGKAIAGNEKNTSEAIKTDVESVKSQAKRKLKQELKGAKQKDFAEPIIYYLLTRCGEDVGLAQDVLQVHKSWDKCFKYIYEQARGQAKGNCAAVRDNVVFEWAEDYFHRDDKAEEEKEAEGATKRKKKEAGEKKASGQKSPDREKTKEAAVKKDNGKKVEPQKPKRNPKEVDGQMDLFSMMGM